MPQTAMNATVPSTQQLVALLVLYLLAEHEGLTEAELRRRITTLSGDGFWRPGKGTVSEVVRDLLAQHAIEGEWRNPEGRRYRPFRLTSEGRQRLRVMREQLREPVLIGCRFFDRLASALYGSKSG
jgi:DNA-binding PadR family transcriptional regulator